MTSLTPLSRLKFSQAGVCGGLCRPYHRCQFCAADLRTTWVVGISQAATGIASAAIGPAIRGLTLGLVGQDGLSHQLG